MITLPNDMWDLFCLPAKGNLSKWPARFIGSSPMIYCHIRFCDYCKKMKGNVEDRLVDMIVGHEITHYLHVMALMPIQKYYWTWLYSFVRFDEIIAGKDGEELRMAPDAMRMCCAPPSPLSDDISVPIRNKKLGYELVLEGLATAAQLAHHSVSSELRKIFIHEAFGELDLHTGNQVHLSGLLLMQDLSKYIDPDHLGPDTEEIFSFMNLLPLFNEKHRKMIERFFSVGRKVTGEEQVYACIESFQRSLESVKAVGRNRGLFHQVLKRRPEMESFLCSMLWRKAEDLGRKNYDSGRHRLILATVAHAAYVLSFTFFRWFPKYAPCQEGELKILGRQGMFSMPIIFRDGVLGDFYPGRGTKTRAFDWDNFIATGTWLNFMVIKELILWFKKDRDELACPFYRFFVANFGEEDATNILKRFCKKIYDKDIGRPPNVSPCKGYCTSDDSVLDICKLAARKKELCLFWMTVLKVFRKFKKVRRCG